jgi:hypothetical protein
MVEAWQLLHDSRRAAMLPVPPGASNTRITSRVVSVSAMLNAVWVKLFTSTANSTLKVIGATVKLGRADETGFGGIGGYYPNLGLKSSELLVYLVGLSYNMLLLDSKH